MSAAGGNKLVAGEESNVPEAVGLDTADDHDDRTAFPESPPFLDEAAAYLTRPREHP